MQKKLPDNPVGLLYFIWHLYCCLSFGIQVEYKYDKEMMKGCVIPVVDDKLTVLALKNNEMASTVSLLTVSVL